MEKLALKAIIRYIRKHFPKEADEIIRRAATVLPELKAKAPDLGGKENSLANNLDLFLLILSYYEASDRRMGGDAIDEIIADMYEHGKFLNHVMNINKKGILSLLRNTMYKSYQKYADKVEEKQAHGEWMDTWKMVVNPNNTNEGIAFTLVGCPLAEYAKKYGYEELMPHLCALDHAYAKVMHAKLIRTHTVAKGADSCDYWYVPDQSETAKNYTGIVV